jgi:hypothetical protein
MDVHKEGVMGNRFRWLGVVVFLAVIAATGVFTYNLGLARGLAQTASALPAPGAAAPLVYYPYPWHWGFGFGFFPFFGLLWLFLIFGVLRRLFWGWGGGWHRGYGHYRYVGPVPPEFDEWHRRAHGQQTPASDTRL